jgi:prepilin-type N-terminal cleavage/methylation domain-containing protein
MKRNQSGFTLIEIAIVLVIIGLLLGGVLKGQELINSAKVKNLASDFRNIPLYIYSYQDKYHALPGDDPLAATHVTSAIVATTPLLNDVGNGRIDGKWDSTTATDESFLFWQHVRLSGIAAGITDTTDTVGYPARNTLGGRMSVTNSGVNNSGVNNSPILNLKGSYIVCSSSIVGKFAKQLDVALDDGNPMTGAMMSMVDTGSHPALVGTAVVPDDTTLYTVCMGS